MVVPVLVCHQLRSPDNLGAIARVMANFGLGELILSDPLTHDFRGVERLGVKADHVLSRFAVASSLPEALSTVVYAVGTTSRSPLKRFSVVSPEEGVDRLRSHASRGRVALVLGGEKRGLSDEELSWCHDVLAIPTDEAQPSMNVSHAAAVLAYLCRRGPLATAVSPLAPPPRAELPDEEGAPLGLVQRLEARLKAVLLEAGYLNPQAPDHVLRELTRALVHGRLTRREAELWMGAVEQLGRMKGPGKGP